MTAVLTVTSKEIVRGALLLIGEVDANQAVPASQMQDGLTSLNYLFKSWQAQGLHLWTKTEGVLFLDVGRTDYKLGPSGDEAGNADDFIDTEMSIAGIATDKTINLDSTAGMEFGNLIGIRLDDNTRHWSDIVTVISSTQILINDGLPSSSAIGNSVFVIPELLPRPVRILQLRRDRVGTTDEIEANQWSREEYFAQPNKSSQGTINNWYYSPQLTDGRLYIWQTANDVDQIARFTYERPIDVTLLTSDNPDFPSEWFRTIKVNLAADIGPEYRIPQDRLAEIKADAFEMLTNSLGFDFESDSMDMQPEVN